DYKVTGVQTCALPISVRFHAAWRRRIVPPGRHQSIHHVGAVSEIRADFSWRDPTRPATLLPLVCARLSPLVERRSRTHQPGRTEIGRASCRERVEIWV